MTSENFREKVLRIARDILENEGRSVLAAKERLDYRFPEAVELILKSKGRLIVSGMGKSGLIGRKISATLSSMGTPSFFVHPGEALHGDLGTVTDNDVVLLLSNSGETDEVIRLIPFLRRIGAKILALTGNMESTLAKMADISLNASVEREACPMNLAPTNSTTVALALGDALAVALAQAREFKEKDFARLHPSGNLGKKFIKVRDLMHVGKDIPVCSPNLPLKEAISLISRGKLGFILISDSENLLLGIITDGDLRRYFEKTDGSLSTPVARVMTPNPKRIGPDRLAMEALKIMEEKSITSLAVVDEANKIIGVLHLHDILKSRLV